MLKKVAKLQEAVMINKIVHIQKAKNFHITYQEFQENNKINQDKLVTTHDRVKELESQIKTYQHKDEDNMEALIRASTFEMWMNKDRPSRES